MPAADQGARITCEVLNVVANLVLVAGVGGLPQRNGDS